MQADVSHALLSHVGSNQPMQSISGQRDQKHCLAIQRHTVCEPSSWILLPAIHTCTLSLAVCCLKIALSILIVLPRSPIPLRDHASRTRPAVRDCSSLSRSETPRLPENGQLPGPTNNQVLRHTPGLLPRAQLDSPKPEALHEMRRHSGRKCLSPKASSCNFP